MGMLKMQEQSQTQWKIDGITSEPTTGKKKGPKFNCLTKVGKGK